MRVHRALAVLYGVLALLLLAFVAFDSSVKFDAFGALIVGVPALFHGLIALGAARANRVAQVFSVLTGVFMLFGFPIGTAIGIYLLINASWQRPPSQRGMAGPA